MSIGKRHGVRMEKLIIRAAKLTTVVTLLKISNSDNDFEMFSFACGLKGKARSTISWESCYTWAEQKPLKCTTLYLGD